MLNWLKRNFHIHSWGRTKYIPMWEWYPGNWEKYTWARWRTCETCGCHKGSTFTSFARPDDGDILERKPNAT